MSHDYDHCSKKFRVATFLRTAPCGQGRGEANLDGEDCSETIAPRAEIAGGIPILHIEN